jgi:prepilin-type N-terminal cleavage/methylation domain-containing protein
MRALEADPVFSLSNALASSRTRGFTLVEMLVVMLVLSVLAVTVGMRWNDTSTILPYQAELMARNLRHAQLLAMTWGQNLQVVVVTPTNYMVRCVVASATVPCNGAGPVMDPASSSGTFNVVLSNNASITGPALLAFDRLGRPVNPATSALLAVTNSYILSDGTVTWTARVSPITGFVTVGSP